MLARFRHRRSLRIVLIAVAILLLALFALSRPPRKPDFLNATSTAAYSNLVSIATEMVGELNKTNRTEFLAQNKATLEAARRAIQYPIERPDASYRAENSDIMELVRVKKLALALVAEGEIAEEQKRYREAANLYFDTIRMGERLEHGPMINFFLGAATERAGLRPLEPMLSKLGNADLAELAPKLQVLNKSRITLNEILQREHYFIALNATNFVEALKDRFSRQMRGSVETMRESQFTLRAQIEIAAATMAAIRYAREDSAPLTNVESLVPRYLPKVPIDPFSNQPLLVVKTTNGPSIYSVGPNKRDDHGKSDDIVGGHKDSTWLRVLSGALSGQ